MGTRTIDNLLKREYSLLFCEKGEGVARLHERGLSHAGIGEAIRHSGCADTMIGKISRTLVPLMRRDATTILLDPAAAYAGELALRDDCTFVVTHPCITIRDDILEIAGSSVSHPYIGNQNLET